MTRWLVDVPWVRIHYYRGDSEPLGIKANFMKPFKNQFRWILGLAASLGLVLPGMAQIQFASSAGSTNGAAMVPTLGKTLPLYGAAFYMANNFPQASSFAQGMPQIPLGGSSGILIVQSARVAQFSGNSSSVGLNASDIIVPPSFFGVIQDLPGGTPDVVMPEMPEIPEPSSFAVAAGVLTILMCAIPLICRRCSFRRS